MSDSAIRKLQDFLDKHRNNPELLLALLPLTSGRLAWRLINLLKISRLITLPLQRQLESMLARSLDDKTRRLLQGEIIENLKGAFPKRLWKLAQQVPQSQRDDLIERSLGRFSWGLPGDPDTDPDSRSANRSRGFDFAPPERRDLERGERPSAGGRSGARPGRPNTKKAREGFTPVRGEVREVFSAEGDASYYDDGWGGRTEERARTQRHVQTGFAPASTPKKPVDPKDALRAGVRYFYWFEVGRPVAGAIETQPVNLPPEIPAGATIEVVLFGFSGGFEIEPGADIGVLRLREDGVVEVEDQPGESKVGQIAQKPGKRLFFPVTAPKRAGIARLRCNLYHKQVLILSLKVEAVIAGRSRAEPKTLDTSGRRLRSSPDYVLSRSLAPAHLGNLGEHRFSLMINDSGKDSHDFRFFGADGKERIKKDVHVEALALQDEIRLGREALRMAAWGDAGEWNVDWDPVARYRYSKPLSRRELAADLARLAYAGYRLYLPLSRRLAGKEREKLERATLAPGLVQVALKESASLVFPAAILYDIAVDSNAFPIETTEHRLCEVFEAALAGTAPLEDCACFHGGCPQRKRVAEILADPQRLVKEAGPVICPSGFWGFRHAIGLPVSVAEAPDAPGNIPFQGAPRIAIGVSTDPNLKLRPAHEIALQNLRPGVGWERKATRDDVLRMLKATKAQLVYFYCHGGITASRIPYFEVGYGESGITPDNLPGNGIVWKSPRPLVFINGCHTTALSPEVALNLVSAFVEEAEAAGVIGTEITVFEPLACTFAEACLKRFLKGGQLGEAVRGARLELLKQGNPLGLAYIPFALASLALVEQSMPS